MQVYVKGGTKTQKKYVKSIAQFCGEKLLGSRLDPKITVNIELKKDLMSKENIYGDACPEEWERRPKEFEIRIDSSQRLRQLLQTVAHELVHVKQYAKDELHEYTMKKGHRYNGKFYHESTDYWDEPWEIEAHGREVGLFIRWAESEKLANRSWTQDS